MKVESSTTTQSEVITPYIPATQTLPELTIKAVVTGVLLSAILAGANAYLGLKVGLTVSASIPAAVLSMAILRMFRQHNILENNLVQTAASAGESLAAGVIFTLPALIMLGHWSKFEFLPTMAIAFFGGCLGVMFTIPLRRALILESSLKFPEGVATGEVLKAGEEGGGGAKLIAVAGIAGALVKLLQTGFQTVAGALHWGIPAGRSVVGVASEMSGALLAVGYIVGLNISILVFIGSVIAWWIGIPLYMAIVDDETLRGIIGTSGGYDAARAVAGAKIRYLGVGAMATGGLWALVALLRPIRDGIRSSLEAVRAAKSGQDTHVPRTERDIPINYVLIGTLGLALPIFVVFFFVIDRSALDISSQRYAATIIIGVLFSLIAGFLFSSVAGYMAGLVGSSNNPISGVTIATILSISFILLALLASQVDFGDGEKARAAAATAILVGAVVCCAAAIAGDNMQDLKAGQIVGATPYKQQIMQMLGVAAGAVVLAPILQLLLQAYGLGGVGGPGPIEIPAEMQQSLSAFGHHATTITGKDSSLDAPQAGLMSTVAAGVFSLASGDEERQLPWMLIALGAALAVLVIALDQYLKSRQKNFRTPVLAVAVGLYLPMASTAPIFIGGLVAHLAERRIRSRSDSERKVAGRRGLLFASGIITGEALIGILLAIPFAIYEDANVWAISGGDGLHLLSQILGGACFVGFGCWMYRVVTQRSK